MENVYRIFCLLLFVYPALRHKSNEPYEPTNRVSFNTFEIYSAMSIISALDVIAPREWINAIKNLMPGSLKSDQVVRESPCDVT